MTPLEIVGLMGLFIFGMILIPIAIGLLVKGYWDIIKFCYSIGRGSKRYKLVEIKK